MSTFIYSIFFFVWAFIFIKIIPNKQTLWKKLPRERKIGTFIGFIVLMWAAYYSLPMLEGPLEKYRILVKLLVPVVTVLSYFYLDYIFTRALGGIMILGILFVLEKAFIHHIPARWVLSLLCYAWSIPAMYLIGAPWRFRNLLRNVAKDPKKRKIHIGLYLFSGGIFLVFTIVGIIA
ncbi:MAG: hypothetical protein U9O87_00310 [Verrucomicrobiota bacterium]|nr:hypothetical protein [Verrucomicrobiota bacterium]